MGWRDYGSAPAPGTAICRADAVKEVLSVEVPGPAGAFPLLILRRGGGFRGYVNACPHQYLPLDYRGPQILSADGAKLMCTAHGALFDAEDGAAIQGTDCALDAVPLEEIAGLLRIASV